MVGAQARPTESMNKSELIKRMSEKLDQLTSRDVDLAVHTIIEIMSESLASGDRIEIRGFGTFSNRYRKPRSVRNPKTGEVGIHKPGKYVPHFKPGKDLKKRVDESRDQDNPLSAMSTDSPAVPS
ncbi:MAG TPA: integration host factor subunit beta [Pseudomonadales bacterium]|mgnify:CR=1 FL=1|jgi:integration host factor subunit beta|nr:integration host factor subunit beta [Pseudomonadales bacterium]MDP6315045.1 integration host factor subunit beta [Pseudomonadales bacterium]MDP7577392.1 integration host factor subunit beta [Pseudomonadales bacterium]HJL61665.1 integration host factor subunit beta [Pseudomonadales bacterium]HJP52179.1 integration host factor subunit beta [Pseudomonadales bacterium]|tara:strand:+ start:11194 stop:11568 length:375 start_codon:yes stop_codon:yes gene_type:complete